MAVLQAAPVLLQVLDLLEVRAHPPVLLLQAVRALHQVAVLPVAPVHLLQAAQVEVLVHPQAHLHPVDLLAVLLIDQADLPRHHPVEHRLEVRVNHQVPVSTLVVPHLRVLQ